MPCAGLLATRQATSVFRHFSQCACQRRPPPLRRIQTASRGSAAAAAAATAAYPVSRRCRRRCRRCGSPPDPIRTLRTHTLYSASLSYTRSDAICPACSFDAAPRNRPLAVRGLAPRPKALFNLRIARIAVIYTSQSDDAVLIACRGSSSDGYLICSLRFAVMLGMSND